MALELTLLPAYHRTAVDISLDVLRLFEAGELWDAIKALPSETAPRDLRTWLGLHAETGCRYDGERSYGPTKTDAYGDRLHMVNAGDLATLADHPAVQKHPRNVAAWAYIAALPADWPVVIYWH